MIRGKCRACGHKRRLPQDRFCIYCLRARDGIDQWKLSKRPFIFAAAVVAIWGIFLWWLLYIYPHH